MDLGDLAGVKTVDWLIIVFFLAFFVLGFAQGTIRRLIGIGTPGRPSSPSPRAPARDR